MTDVIHLLPDSVANQIAAGEVVQRPASAVKELLENSIDAGADRIKLVIKDAGKTLIQVIDNGKGMTETDARMAFERHATSKIEKAEDIFTISTKGFRGEALASIAAVAQVELKSKQEEQELGTLIRIEGSKIVTQEYCNTSNGTGIEVKNLFFNIPARRNFLKSDHIELRHIIDEFERIALAHPGVHLSFINNGHELFDLPKAALRQRIVNVFGNKFNEKLVPVEEETPILKLSGFIGKPEFAKKTRGEQFFFANDRFIKNAYLHRAVCMAFEGLINHDYHPSYFLFLELDPAKIDVNIHPTKTEIKFEDEKAVHTIIRTSVKHALGQYNISPTLDFETDQRFAPTPPDPERVQRPGITVDTSFNPFDDNSSRSKKTSVYSESAESGERQSHRDWESVMNQLPDLDTEKDIQSELPVEEYFKPKDYQQIGNKYMVTLHKGSLMIIHQARAHERILYERLLETLKSQSIPSQQLLFPQNISFAPADYELLKPLLPILRETGFDIDEFGKNEVIVHGVPLILDTAELKVVLEKLLEDEKDHKALSSDDHKEKMALSMAISSAIKVGQSLSSQEMNKMVDELFACKEPSISPSGQVVIVNLSQEELDKSFN